MGHHSVEQHPHIFWPRMVVRKWLNIKNKASDYGADSDSGSGGSGSGSDSDQEQGEEQRESCSKNEKGDKFLPIIDETHPRLRRRTSETFRAQYIKARETRQTPSRSPKAPREEGEFVLRKECCTRLHPDSFNFSHSVVNRKFPPDDLDIDGWLDIEDPADIYVIGIQEMIPLNAGNIFGAEDHRPVSKWENIIRESLNKVPQTTKYKSYSDPPSPSRFMPLVDAPLLEDEILLGSDSESEEEIFPISDNVEAICFEDVPAESGAGKDGFPIIVKYLSTDEKVAAALKERNRLLGRSNCMKTDEREVDEEALNLRPVRKLTRSLGGTEKIGLSWPERPLHLLPQRILERPKLKSAKSLESTKTSRTFNSFKPNMIGEDTFLTDVALLGEIDLESLINRRRRSPYVRIISKQMVGIFLTIWVRRSLRKHIQHLSVSSVGVGAMGYIGNKGSISVSMSLYQTLFCFVCTHLSSGEKDTDFVKRNAVVHEIHRRTHFNSPSEVELPQRICDHERLIWLGDLNYRINLPYEKTRELIFNKDWAQLVEGDQLIKEMRKGRAFDGWSEGKLDFAPTYKYEVNSQEYIHPEAKAARRNPAWCDRILSFGKGMKLLRYRTTELMFSDHRPVTATYMVEVEEFCPRKLQRALTFTNAEIEDQQLVPDFRF